MLKLLLVPDQTNYSASSSVDVVMSKVDGGQPRYRRDVLDAPITVELQFTMDPQEYQYLRAFYNYINKGADAFLMDLLIETPALREYAVNIKPGSWKLASVKGHSFVVKFTVEAHPNDAGLDYAQIVADFTPEPYVAPPAPTDWGGTIE